MNSDNHSGIIWSLACLIILTLGAVLLATLVDRKHGASKLRSSLLGRIADGEHNLGNLRDELESLNARYDAAQDLAKRSAAGASSKGKLASEMRSSVELLRARCEELQASIPKLREEYGAYRESYRKKAWLEASGERIGNLLLKSGRSFEDVTISRVTPIGIEISHANGIARIDSQDLGGEFAERFQWDEKERALALQKELANRERITRVAPAEPSPPVDAPVEISGEELEKIRSQVRALQAKAMTLKGSIGTAERESRYASNRSVPGSLRTWAEQAMILKSDLARTEALLALAKDRLRAANPSDPLLLWTPAMR
ncbi:hypothetical protein HZ994_03070 [Akkermansiaceae bacterium]|nr:hypothetical protein HZ994_03070 [Akkermansiaceae bacterium]